MITHQIPETPVVNLRRFDEYFPFNAQLVPLIGGRYVVALGVRTVFGHYARTQVFLVAPHGLTPVLQRKDQLDHPDDDIGSVQVSSDDSEAAIMVSDRTDLRVTYYLGVPDLRRTTSFQSRPYTRPKHASRNNITILTGVEALDDHAPNLFRTLFPHVTPLKSEAVVIRHTGPTGFELTRMTVASTETGQVSKVAISPDGLTAAALIRHEDRPHELTIWDLDQ